MILKIICKGWGNIDTFRLARAIDRAQKYFKINENRKIQ